MRTFPWHEVIYRAYEFAANRRIAPRGHGQIFRSWFDSSVAQTLAPGADVFIGFSGMCIKSLMRAQAVGAMAIVERGSTHISFQHDILAEESRITGLEVELPALQSIDREMKEYSNADYIAVPTAFAKATFVERGIASQKVLVNPYGVDLTRFLTRRPHTYEVGKPTTVIHVGRVSARKGIQYLVDAVGRCANVRLLLVGGIDPGVERLIKRPFVTVVGAVPGSELPRYYEQADIFALLSIEEGLALVIPQAMAMGLPIVATPNTGAEAVMRPNIDGLLVPIRDPTRAAEAIQRLVDEPDLRQAMGIAARQRVSDGFSWVDYGNRAADIYARILRQRSDNSGCISILKQK